MSQVDVIVPCYNYARYLTGCVDSVLQQAGVDVRVLILDDASPDETPAVAQALVERDSRVVYRRHAANQGHIATYNEGIAWAEADYMLVLSADDLLVPNALFRAAELMDAHPEVGLVYGRALQTSRPESESIDEFQSYNRKVMTGTEFLSASCIDATNIVPTPTAVVRTSVQHAVGGYSSDLPHTADLEMWLRLAAHGSVGVVDALQAFYRIHPQNMSLGYPGLSDVREKWAAFERLFREYGHRIERADNLQRLVHRNLLQEIFQTAYRCRAAGAPGEEMKALALAAELTHDSWRGAWFRFRCRERVGPRGVRALGPLVRAANSVRTFFRDAPKRASSPTY